jgi:hypothetical protein
MRNPEIRPAEYDDVIPDVSLGNSQITESAQTFMLATLRGESVPNGMAGLANSDGCRAPQPNSL